MHWNSVEDSIVVPRMHRAVCNCEYAALRTRFRAFADMCKRFSVNGCKSLLPTNCKYCALFSKSIRIVTTHKSENHWFYTESGSNSMECLKRNEKSVPHIEVNSMHETHILPHSILERVHIPRIAYRNLKYISMKLLCSMFSVATILLTLNVFIMIALMLFELLHSNDIMYNGVYMKMASIRHPQIIKWNNYSK